MKQRMNFSFVKTCCLSFHRHDWNCGFDFCIETSAESLVATEKMTCYDLVYACLVPRFDRGHDDHWQGNGSCFWSP